MMRWGVIMKKSIIAQCAAMLLAANLFAVSTEASQINTIVDTGSGMFAEPEKVYKEIDGTLKNWFFPSEKEREKMTFSQKHTLKSGEQIVLVPISDSDGIVQVYREEKGAAVSSDEMITGTNARNIAITKEDLAKLSKELGSDYIMYFRVTNTVPTVSVGFLSAGQKTNVTTDFRVWDAQKESYVFVKRYVTTGSSSSFYLGVGSASNAVEDGLRKALKQIDKDKDKIIAVVK